MPKTYQLIEVKVKLSLMGAQFVQIMWSDTLVYLRDRVTDNDVSWRNIGPKYIPIQIITTCTSSISTTLSNLYSKKQQILSFNLVLHLNIDVNICGGPIFRKSKLD